MVNRIFLFSICVFSPLLVDAQSVSHIDFKGYDISGLNSSQDWIRTVFELPVSRMSGGPDGVQLKFDVANHDGPFDYTYRSELRETDILQFPATGTTQVYSTRFNIDELPDLCGPMTVFQRFNRDNDGPDIELELTGKNQFGDAIANALQVVAFGLERERLDRFLKPKNDLAIMIYNHANGRYRISLNGETISESLDTNTLPSLEGTWTQFGLYPHGLHDAGNRLDQIASGETQVAFTYEFYTKNDIPFDANFEQFQTSDLNGQPNSFSVVTGQLASGNEDNLRESDNDWLVLRRGNSVEAKITIDVEGTSFTDTVSTFSLVAESRVLSRRPVSMSTSFYNFETEEFEMIDVRDANRTQDERSVVSATGELQRFVEPTTRSVRARIEYIGAPNRLRYSVNLDQLFWMINQ